MPIGITDDHRALAASLGDWAGGLHGPALAREAEGVPDAAFATIRDEVAKQGLSLIAVPEERGGAGGTLLDLAVAIEACAEALLPGPLLGSAIVATVLGRAETLPGDVAATLATGAAWGLARDGVVYDAGGADDLLVRLDGAWYVGPASLAEPVAGLDLSRRAGRLRDVSAADLVALPGVSDALVEATTLTLAAAEAAAVANPGSSGVGWMQSTGHTSTQEASLQQDRVMA